VGELIVAAVPLGNISDASDRLKSAIQNAELIAAEDSRRFLRLCKDLNIEPRAGIISFFEGNETERLAELKNNLEQNSTVLLVTDAGMPTISDPGYRAIRMAIDSGFDVKVLPGPSAVTMALALSGLATDRFCFEGFPPRSDIARDSYLDELKSEKRTMVFFESPHRVGNFVSAAVEAFGPRRMGAICREMTKTYEETIRGSLAELLKWTQSKEMLGEFTIVIAGFNPAEITHSDVEIAALVKKYEQAGMTRKESISLVAKELKISKRTVFDIMIEHK